MDHLSKGISSQSLFPKAPRLRFIAEQPCCCGSRCQVRKSEQRTIFTLEIGKFHADESQFFCESCQQIYHSQELRELVAPQCNYGFDVLVYVGQALFLRCGNEKRVQEELSEKNIPISLREIGYLGKKFIVYLALTHQEGQEKMKRFFMGQGGYILHLDGTCEGDSPHLITTLDALSNMVLDTVKLPSENAKQLIPFLSNLKAVYGNPVAIVHDMGSAIAQAIESVFPGIADFICHFHFLRDLGKDLFGYEYSRIRDDLAQHKIRRQLGQTKKKLKQTIDETSELTQCLEEYLKGHQGGKPKVKLLPPVRAYILIVWVLEAKCELNGFGFPFDRLHFVFYQRLQAVNPAMKKLTQVTMLKNLLAPLSPLIAKTIKDPSLQCMSLRMKEKVHIFEQLREAMRLASPQSKKGLNDDGDEGEMASIQKRLIQFRQSEELKRLASEDGAYQKMLKQIDKYWEKLFAEPIVVKTAEGLITIQPQRTNNILERLFRDLKRSGRKKNGTHSLRKSLNSMIAETPLVKNLENPHYMNLILNGKKSLAERFAQIDVQKVRQELKENQKQIQDLPAKMREIAKIPNLPKKLI